MSRGKARKSGYYWVMSFEGKWHIAQFISPVTWLRFNDEESYHDENFKEIDEHPIERPFGYELLKRG